MKLGWAFLLAAWAILPLAATAQTRIARISDLEGDLEKFEDFLAGNPNVFRGPQGELELAEGVHFVYGGDVGDRGPHSRKIFALLNELKAKFPDRVTLIAGNRDINKMRLLAELSSEALAGPPARNPAAYATWLAEKEFAETPGNRLKWILEKTMGAPGAFEFKRQELAAEAKLRGLEIAITDDAVVDAFREEVRPGGVVFEYLKNAQIAAGIDKTLVVHGGVSAESMGYVPEREGRIGKVREWVDELNAWYRREFDEWASKGGRSGAEKLVAYQEPDPRTPGRNPWSTVYGRFADDSNNTKLPDENVIAFVRDGGEGFDIVTAGHTPNGSTPTIVKTKDFMVIVDDNSWAVGHRANRVVIQGKKFEVSGHLPDGMPVKYFGFVGDASPIGKLGPNQYLIAGENPDGAWVTKHVDEKFRVDEITVAKSEWPEAILKEAWKNGTASHNECSAVLSRLLK